MYLYDFLKDANFYLVWGIAIVILALDFKALLTIRILKYLSLAYIAYLFIIAIVKAVLQWDVWASSPISNASFVQSGYFSLYAITRFFFYPLFTLCGAFLFGLTVFCLEKYSKASWLSREEVWLAILASLLVGWPAVLVLMILTFGLMLAFSLISKIRHRVLPKRIPFSPFVYVALVLSFLFGVRLMQMLGLMVLMV